jgi:hypothetical protein
MSQIFVAFSEYLNFTKEFVLRHQLPALSEFDKPTYIFWFNAIT